MILYNPTKPLKIFCSYSHMDENFLNELEIQLSPLKRNGLIHIWHDGKIIPGELWEKKLQRKILSADLMLFFISPNFFNSHYCYEKELDIGLTRYNQGKIHIIPIILSPVSWQSSIFKEFEVLPEGGKPITQWRTREEGWQNVVDGIAAAINFLPQKCLKRSMKFISLKKTSIEKVRIAQHIALDTDSIVLSECLDDLKTVFIENEIDPIIQHWIAIAIGNAGSQDAINLLSELSVQKTWHSLVEKTLKDELNNFHMNLAKPK
jgi:hypothetical protein